ncbi:MAG: 4Fe-4S dicluster domain-containing protein [Gemmatimonadales bacterium]|nr:4Fe-4S dicluster domain-containing protein [Gemmatimonadales bacterium]
MSDPRRDAVRGSLQGLARRLLDAAEDRMVKRRYLRPPGALPEVGFLAACTRCGLCAEACPPKAIIHVPTDGGLAAGTPYLDPDTQPCTLCPDMPCATACPTEALTLPPARWSGYRLGALELLPERCITFRDEPCGACADACPVGPAALVMDAAGHPVLRPEGCTGCGACVVACIATPRALRLTPAEG